MPIYEYECTKCGKNFEIFQKIGDDPLTVCRVCGGTLNKLISQCSFHLKGTGWYVTDYKKPADSVGGKLHKERKEESAAETVTETKTETATTEKKTETTSAGQSGG
jgi:putative FmdB family regulatory protein